MRTSSNLTETVRRSLATLLKIVLVNVVILLLLLVPIELIFGSWVRPLGIDDLKRFSIPIGVSYEYDVSALYESDVGPRIRYTRDQWGLRGGYRSLSEIELITVGGSTTDQKFLDDSRTWQAFTERELMRLGRPLVIANAGVDGQSTVGHLFDFQNWFPLLADLKPKYVLFYVGVNDVLRVRERGQFDAKVDASSWRAKSAVWQFARTLRANLTARSVQVSHGRMPRLSDADFTNAGTLAHDQREALAAEVTNAFMENIEKLRQATIQFGATPIFVTQTAFAWHAGAGLPRGLKQKLSVHNREMNYADISFLHQAMNRELLQFCRTGTVTCFDLATESGLETSDFYDYVHLTPKGAAKIGRYLAVKLSALPREPRARPSP